MGKSDLIIPNTFLIGAQKAATTSVYNWLSQHPEICAPMATKDLGYFTREDLYPLMGLAGLSEYYKGQYKGEKIIINGSVHYIFFEKALKRIASEAPLSRFILVVRDPVERALSAYAYAKKFNYETLPLEEALEAEPERQATGDHRTLSELTYLGHGLYYRQIQTFLQYFKPSQLRVVLYEDVSNTPREVVRDLFEFLEVAPDFQPDFKVLNTTGSVKNKALQRVAFGDNPVRNFLVRKVLRALISEDKWTSLRWKVINMNTRRTRRAKKRTEDQLIISRMRTYFKSDIAQLEEYLNRDLSHWK